MSATGVWIKQYRESNGLTQAELGKKIGKSPRTISHWEIGERDPGTENIRKLADVLGITVPDLMGETIADTDRFFKVRARGDDMAPEIKEDDVLTVERGAVISDGDYVIVSRPGVEDVCRRIYAFGGLYSLIAVNPSVRPLTVRRSDIEIKGKVTEIRRSI